MTSHQKRIVKLAERQLKALTPPDGRITMRHRDGGPKGKSLELMFTYEEQGHMFAARQTVPWYSCSDAISRIVMNLLQALQAQYVSTMTRMRLDSPVSHSRRSNI